MKPKIVQMGHANPFRKKAMTFLSCFRKIL